jgi:hypothetical protein
MSLADLNSDLVGAFVGFVLTILAFSYIFGDNPLFRLSLHIFIGVAVGFTAVVVFYNVILFQLVVPLLQDPLGSLHLLVPMVVGVWLLVTKASPRLAPLGNPPMAYLVGAGAATAVGGAVLGTLFPQAGASAALLDFRSAQAVGLDAGAYFMRGLIILVGTVTTLLFFYYGTHARQDRPAERPRWIQDMGQVGLIFIAITFGVLFAGVYAAALTALIERMNFLIDFLIPLIATI